MTTVGKPTTSVKTSAQDLSSGLWQHPYVDVFKHFKLMPQQDWKVNKKHGEVADVFAKEIGRKAMVISGSISANNYIQIPSPASTLARSGLGLTGRYLYIQLKAPASASPVSFHIDLQLTDRSHNIRLSASNLYKQFSTQNGMTMQVPLSLDLNRWTVAVFDIYNLLSMSGLLPPTYTIHGGYSIKSVTMCANCMVRGVYTSDNLYDFVTLPPEMRFKFSFDISRWPENFAWLELPQDVVKAGTERTDKQKAEDRATQVKAKSALRSQNNQQKEMKPHEREGMQQEIDQMTQFQDGGNARKVMQAEKMKFVPPYSAADMMGENEKLGHGIGSDYISEKAVREPATYVTGQYCNQELVRSPKLNFDPIMELQHIIGYSPDRCLDLKWSKVAGENVMLFSSSGTLIAMDTETRRQQRFFYGHSAPICCFDVSAQGTLIASAQEGKNSLIRIWDYQTARCLSIVTMPVTTLKCLSFSPDGKLLASVGKDAHNKEMIIIWDISKVGKMEKPEIVARQTSDVNILCLKFSPVDNTRLVSCGKENIRFWRIRETQNIRSSAVVLNHHTRNTVFASLDFEFAARATPAMGNADSSKENDALKRVYVASKNGMVFQINYLTESLEATYQTNDSAIYSIAVNEAFCVTGSEDNYVRVWPLDFSEFYLEAKHEDTVCSVDISTDGLRIICGTMYGSIGLLDKSNQNYKTLIRCHTDSILCMEYHKMHGSIITVSRDKTIRLWSKHNYDQNVEFASPIDQPLCVAAHPHLPIFAAGFESGTMRIFDIEKTAVNDEFTQFNNHLTKIAYSPSGELLVSVCVDGSVSLHNATRQHLPFKMMHLQFAPEFVHISFSAPFPNQRAQGQMGAQEYGEEDEEARPRLDSLFGLVGDHGNTLMIYETESINVCHKISVGQVIRSFKFTENLREVIIVTKDQRIKVYTLSRFEGTFIRELTSVHREGISSVDLSKNGQYMITSGDDKLLKMWDTDASKAVPYYFQAFTGHTFPVESCMFNPEDNGTVYSTGEKDGIYVWKFFGDTTATPGNQENVYELEQANTVAQRGTLENLRNAAKEMKKPVLQDNSFVVPAFDLQENVTQGAPLSRDLSTTALKYTPGSYYEEQVKQLQLPYKHYLSVKKCREHEEVRFEKQMNLPPTSQWKIEEPLLVQGYDGFSGAHDNLMWEPFLGNLVYTLHNKLIAEDIKDRHQTIAIEAVERLSCMARSEDGKLVAVAQGDVGPDSVARIFIYQINAKANKGDTAEPPKLLNTLSYHHSGIQSLCFAKGNEYLLSLGNKDGNCWAAWRLSNGRLVQGYDLDTNGFGPQNQILVDPTVRDESRLEFVTVGQQGGFLQFGIDLGEFEDQPPQLMQPQLTEEMMATDFVCAAYTPHIKAKGGSLLLLGCKDGAMLAYNPRTQSFDGPKIQASESQIGCISVTCGSSGLGHVVIGTSAGEILRFGIDKNGDCLPTGGYESELELNSGGIVALAMDSLNQEGLAGTQDGSIFYLSFKDGDAFVPLIRKLTNSMEKVSQISHVPDGPENVIIGSSGEGSGQVKLMTATTLDQIHLFEKEGRQAGPVACVLMAPSNFTKFNKQGKLPSVVQMVVYRSGHIKMIDTKSLNERDQWNLSGLEAGEEITCGSLSPYCHNFALGTSYGNMYVGHYIKEPQADTTFDLRGKKNPTSASYQLKATRIEGNEKDGLVGARGSRVAAVTSVQMSAFNPEGYVVVTFDSGLVRTWKINLRRDARERLQGQGFQDLTDMGYVQFDVHDDFDMITEGRQVVGDFINQDAMARAYAGNKYDQCQAVFAVDNSASEYISYCSAVQFLFIRNYIGKELRLKIALEGFPTCLRLDNFSALEKKVGESLSSKKGKGQKDSQLAAVGTKCGRVFVYQIYKGQEEAGANSTNLSEVRFQTRGGLLYGEVSAISQKSDGEHLTVASSSGELLNFDYQIALQQRQE